VWAVDANASFARPGPRLVDGVEALAAILHPDALGPPDPVVRRSSPLTTNVWSYTGPDARSTLMSQLLALPIHYRPLILRPPCCLAGS